MKKLLSLVICLVMAFTMTTSAFAETISETSTTGLTGPEWEGLTLGEDYTIDENGCVVYSYEETKEITISKNTTRAGDVENDIILVKTQDGYDPKTKELQFKVNIDCPTSPIIKPKLEISLELLQADTKYGPYKTVDTMNWTSLNYLSWYELRSTGTHHYKFIVYLRGADLNTVVGHSPYEHYSCRNPTGHRWTFYHTDPNSGVAISEPARTDWLATPVNRIYNFNKKYQDYYNSTYGTNIVCNAAANIEVHHVRPLSLGGTNAWTNAVHIDSNFHEKISSWFKGY